MADRAESNKVPTRNEPNSDQEPQRSRGLDDHPTPPHRDEMNRKTAPGGDSAAPSSPAPVANRITATESPTKKACNGLLQHNRHETDVLCVPTNVCSWWKSGRAADITAMTNFEPSAVFGSIHRTCLSPLVTDRAMETWYHAPIA